MKSFNQLLLRSALFIAVISVVATGPSFSDSSYEVWSIPSAFAQDENKEEMTFEDEEAEAEAEPENLEDPIEGEIDLSGEDLDEPEPEPEPETDPDGNLNIASIDGDEVEAVAWEDIIVVVRKPFLKVGRVELMPLWGITMNDNIIRHFQFAAQLNYYLTDVLAVGLEGQYFLSQLREPFDLVARQARRLPSVNKYNFGASLNFHYVPIYGKFAVLDEHIVHWETALTAGVGFTQSEILPRDPAQESFKNTLITPNVGANMRFFLTRYLTVNVGIRDYIFVDKFEAASRTEVDGNAAKENANSSLVNHLMFQAGISVWFPMSFEYTTFR